MCPNSRPHSTATLCGAVGDKGLGLKINKWNWVHGLGERAGLRLLPGSAEWSPWMRHFPIEVIKMIEDSGKLVHLTARWRGTRQMCQRPKGESASVCFFFSSFFFLMYCIHGVCAGEFQCHTQHELQNGTGSGRWPRDAHRRSMSFPLHIQPKIFTITLKATYILIWPSSNQRAVTKKEEKKLSFSNFSPVILSLCLILFYLFIFGPFYFKKTMWRAAVSAIKGGPPGSSGCD